MALRFLLIALSTYRLCRIVTGDLIGEPVREWARARGPRIGYLASCDWCLSIWVAPIPAALEVAFPGNRAVLGGLVALSASALTGLLAMLEARIALPGEQDPEDSPA